MVSGCLSSSKRGVYSGFNQCKIRNFRATLLGHLDWMMEKSGRSDWFSRAGTDSWSREFLRAACKCVPHLRDKLTSLSLTLPYRTDAANSHLDTSVINRQTFRRRSIGLKNNYDLAVIHASSGGMTSRRYIGWRATNCTVALHCSTFDSTNTAIRVLPRRDYIGNRWRNFRRRRARQYYFGSTPSLISNVYSLK